MALVARLENQLSMTTSTPAILNPDSTRSTAQNTMEIAIGYISAVTAAMAANTAKARM